MARMPQNLKTKELFDRIVESGKIYMPNLMKLAQNKEIELHLARKLVASGNMSDSVYEEIKSEAVRKDKQILEATLESFYEKKWAINNKALMEFINAIPIEVRGDLPKKIRKSNSQKLWKDLWKELKELPEYYAGEIKEKFSSATKKIKIAMGQNKLLQKMRGHQAIDRPLEGNERE
jgi:hypothetical protein